MRILLLLAVLMPQGLKQGLYRRVFGWRIGRGVRIGYSYLEAAQVFLGDGVRIGHFNLIRNIARLEIGRQSVIENFNQFFGPHSSDASMPSELVIGEQVSFMSRHFIDVTGAVHIGSRVIVAGRDSQFWSHTLGLAENEYVFKPTELHIGNDVYVGARVTLVSGSIPPGAIVGAGSVVTKRFAPEATRMLIAGNPAVVKKRYLPHELSTSEAARPGVGCYAEGELPAGES